jgi:hypothetical protein
MTPNAYKLVFVDGAICPTCQKPLINDESMWIAHKGHVDGDKWVEAGLAKVVPIE